MKKTGFALFVSVVMVLLFVTLTVVASSCEQSTCEHEFTEWENTDSERHTRVCLKCGGIASLPHYNCDGDGVCAACGRPAEDCDHFYDHSCGNPYAISPYDYLNQERHTFTCICGETLEENHDIRCEMFGMDTKRYICSSCMSVFDDVPDEMITHHFWDSKAHACMWCGEDEKVEIEDLADYGNAAEETKCISGEEGSGSHHLVVEKDLYNPEYHFLVCHSCNSYTAEAHVPSEWTSRWIYYHDMPCDVCGISYRRGPHRDTDNDGKCDDCGYPAKVCNHEGKLIQYIWTTSYTHTRCCLLCGMRFETEPHKIRNGVCVLCGMKEPQVCNHEEGVEYKAGIVLPDCENEHDVCCRICGACLSVEPHVIGDIQTPNGQEISGCVLCGYYLLP